MSSGGGGEGGGLRGGERTSLVIWQRGGLVQNRGHMDFMNFLQKIFFGYYLFGKIGYENVQFRGRTIFFMPLWMVR